MIKKQHIIPLTLLATCLVSCVGKKEISAPEQKNNTLYGSIKNIDGTKTFLDGLCIKWYNGDRINVDGVEYEAQVNEGDASIATFVPVDSGSDVGVYLKKAIYPSSLYHKAENPYYELPSVFDFAPGQPFIPMYSESINTHLVFYSLFGVLKICMPLDFKVKSVALSSDRYMNGVFKVLDTYENFFEPDFTDGTEANKTTTIVCDTPCAGADLYFPVPTGLYMEKNLKIIATKEDGTKEVMSTNQNAYISIDASTLYKIDFRRDGLFNFGTEGKFIGFDTVL